MNRSITFTYKGVVVPERRSGNIVYHRRNADTAAFRQISSSRGPVYYDLPNRGGAPIGPGGSLPPLFEAKGWGGEGKGAVGRGEKWKRGGTGKGRVGGAFPPLTIVPNYFIKMSSVQYSYSCSSYI